MARLSPAPLVPDGRATNGTKTNSKDFGVRSSMASGRRTKRNLPMVGLGVLLVVGCALGFSSAWLRAGGHQKVLVVTRSLSAGQVLSPADLRSVQLSVASGVASMPSSQLPDVLGRPIASALTSGTLLTASDVAQASGPPAGRADVGLALKPGEYPPGLTTGERVLVVMSDAEQPSPTSTTGPSDQTRSAAPLEATVVGVESAPADSSEAIVVSIQLAQGDGSAVASAASAGDVALAVISSGQAS